jgi:outer membrane protein assembly factor BamA
MAKLKLRLIITFFIVSGSLYNAQSQFRIYYTIVDSASHAEKIPLQDTFSTSISALSYLNNLHQYLQTKGFISASVDRIESDSFSAKAELFLGRAYKWAKIKTGEKDEEILSFIRWRENNFSNGSLQFSELQAWQQKIIDYLENNGHPFASVYLDSLGFIDNSVEAILKVERGPLYHIDSIRIYGDAKITNRFLQQYLSIPNRSVYNKGKLDAVDKKLALLPYVEMQKASDLNLLSTGSVLNVYLQSRKISQVNVLAGFLPNTDIGESKKFQFTVDANILLRNSFGAGETIGLNWQKLQPQSQRLNLLYEHPYVFKSLFGADFRFNMFRQDSAFLNIDMRLGATYNVGETEKATIFFLRRQSIINAINTQQVLITKILPAEGDVRSNNIGIDYGIYRTNSRLNPQKGNEFFVSASAGTKRIKKSNAILELKDPGNPSFSFASLYDTIKLKTYQLRIAAQAARFFPLGQQSTFKTGLQTGIYSSGNIFRNETFQLGGYRLLRGFDEESQYVSQFAVATLEYRYLIGQNSNFFAFIDAGWGKHLEKVNHTYIGTGLGLSFETKAGILNLALALGKRDDTEFNLRQSKVHIGFTNYF